MYQKKNRRVELVERVLKYALMVFGVVTLVVFLMFNLLGYRFNFREQTVEQTGLVQYDSTPRGARVVMDGQLVGTTSTKNTPLPGEHRVEMTLEGYEKWQKTIPVTSGVLSSLQYVRLIPVTKTTTPLHQYKHIYDGAFSPFGRHLMTIADNNGAPELQLTDLRDVTRPVVNVYPLDITKLAGYDVEGVARRFDIVEWDQAGRYALVSHQANSRTDWLMVDREQPTEVTNISTLTGLDLKKVVLSGTSGIDAYGLTTSGDIRQINVRDGTLSRPLISRVSDFSLFNNDIISYVGSDETGQIVGVWKTDWSKPQVVMQAGAHTGEQTGLMVVASRYYMQDTLGIIHDSKLFVYRGDIPNQPESLDVWREGAVTFDLKASAQQLDSSVNGRFIFVKLSGDQNLTYDIERKSLTKSDLGAASGRLDDYYVWSVNQNTLTIQEFDGANRHQLAESAVGIDASWNDSAKHLLYFAPREDGVVELRKLAMRAR